MKRFVVFHDYGEYEGWSIVGQDDTFDGAVILRDDYLRKGRSGGTTEIFEHIPLVVTDGRTMKAAQ